MHWTNDIIILSNKTIRQGINHHFLFFFARGKILMDTPLLLIIGNSRVISDSYRLKLHGDHPTRVTGVLQGPFTNYLPVAPPPSRVLLFEPILKIPWLLNLALGGRGIAPSAIPPSNRGPLRRRWSGSRPPDRHPPPSRYPTRVTITSCNSRNLRY